MRNSRKLSSYDKSILFSVRLSNWIFAFYCLVQLFCPTYSDGSLGFTSLFSYLSIIAIGVGVMGVHGYFNQYVPLLPVCLIRLVQIVLCNIAHKLSQVNIVVFILFCLIDIGICIFFLTDRANYEYVQDKEE